MPRRWLFLWQVVSEFIETVCCQISESGLVTIPITNYNGVGFIFIVVRAINTACCYIIVLCDDVSYTFGYLLLITFDYFSIYFLKLSIALRHVKCIVRFCLKISLKTVVLRINQLPKIMLSSKIVLKFISRLSTNWASDTPRFDWSRCSSIRLHGSHIIATSLHIGKN